MIYTPLTNKALRLSFEAHKDQKDKSDIPYVYHPYEVASSQTSEYAVCVALLHDVVEDTSVTLDDLAKEFPPEVVEAIDLMTHREGVPYFDYVRAIKKNPLAKSVKLADLKHNSTLERKEEITDRDWERVEKYKKAMAILLEE